MKTALIHLIFALTSTTFAFGQAADSLRTNGSKQLEANVSVFNTQLLANSSYSINQYIKYYPTARFGTGVYISCTQRKISDTFTYHIQKPILDYYEFGWTNQYNYITTDKVQANISLINAVSEARLGDNAFKKKTNKSMPKEVATNYFYALEPGAGFSFKIISPDKGSGIWLTAQAGYRFVFGNSKFASAKEFSDYFFGIGISIIRSTSE